MADTLIEFNEVPSRWPEIVALAAEGSAVILTEKSVPVARLTSVPADPSVLRVPGLHPNAICTTDDFDAPLPDDFWAGP